jgi:Phosphotransferase enzyme family
VNSQPQPEHDTWRAIVFSRDGSKVLLRISERGFVFPSVEIPRWERLAENLTAALTTEWGCDAVCLFAPNNSSQDDPKRHHYEVMECWRDEPMRGTDWKPVHSLTADSFHDEAEFRTLTLCLDELDGYEHDPASPFAQRGWITRVRGWAADAICGLGLELGASFRQYNASPSFSLIRFETNGPPVWFKAVGEPNQREFPITLKLAELFPWFIPEILGTRPEWNAWLAREVEGTNLGDTKETALWQKAATGLAELQIESASGADSILDSDAHDLKTDTLFDSVDPFFDVVARLMEEQPRVPPPVLSREELSLLKVRIEDAFTLLGDLQIPNTLGHLDLNPWNVVVSGDRCIFLDWAEAYVGHPFFSWEYLLQHFRREVGADAVLESELVSAYKAPWRQLLSDDLMSEGIALAPLAAVFAYAAGTGEWKDQERLRDPKAGAYFRSLARRMNREAIQFTERRPACLS